MKTFTQRLLIAGAAVSIAVSLMPLVATYWWVFDLFTHFRPQLIAAQIVVLSALFLLGSRRWGLLLSAVALLNVVSARDYLIPGAGPPAGETLLTVMSVNVLSRNTHTGGLVESVEQYSPDILLVLEFTEDWAEALEPLHEQYPFRFERPEDGNFGIALYSRTALTDVRALDLEGAIGVDAKLALDGESIRLIGVHLRPPFSGEWAAARQRQLEEVAALVETREVPVIVFGDFNLTPYSPHFSKVVETAGLRTAIEGRGPAMTWPSFLPILGIPIDHCLVSEELAVHDYERLPDFGSDHFPIVVRLGHANTDSN